MNSGKGRSNMQKIAFLGGGSFGTALSVLLSYKGCKCNIWLRDEKGKNEINKDRKNYKYLKDIEIPEGVEAYCDVCDTVSDCEFVIISVPSHAVRDVCRKSKQYINKNQIIVSIAKGIEDVTFKRMSEVIKEEFPENPVVILSGPSHAEEVARFVPTTVVVSSLNMDASKKVQDLFMTSNFRVYTNDDIIGVEIGGAVKNIIALAAGISDGIGYGDNTKAALMTRGMSEIVRIGTVLGGKSETFYGLTGIGDLIVTCTSMHSRNRRAGILIGKGANMQQAIFDVGMVVEGINACEAFFKLKEQLEISMPITSELHKILFDGKDAKSAVIELMNRDKKHELY